MQSELCVFIKGPGEGAAGLELVRVYLPYLFSVSRHEARGYRSLSMRGQEEGQIPAKRLFLNTAKAVL